MQTWLFDYLQKILNARVYDVAIETALEAMPKLSKRLNNTVRIKREDTQPVFSFKLRGAYNKMVHLSQEKLQKGVICASAGNHAQGVALSAKKLFCRAVVVMPVTTPALKSDAVKALGAEVILYGDSYSDAYIHAKELCDQQGLTFVHPFDDPEVIAGQGTIGMEILRQYQGDIHAIFVAVGGGGLISGIAAYIKAIRPEIKIIGVQMTDSDAMLRSIKNGQRIALKDVGLFSDGTAVKLVGEETFKIASQLVDDFVTVDTDSVCAAIKDIFEDTRCIPEPAGAMGVAAIKKYVKVNNLKDKNLITVTCGANINFDRLRFVSERAEIGEEREALFAVTIPEKRGSFKHFCEIIGNRSVTEFSYRISDENKAHLFVGLSTKSKSESKSICDHFITHGFETLELLENDLSKEHLRYMVGGRSQFAKNERLYRFQFPERPGVLMKFLTNMHPNWNISLFHYRNQGADYGKILVGIQVPEGDKEIFEKFLMTLDYPYTEETTNPVYRMFL